MSKRKSISQSVPVKSNDMIFEDDDDIDEQTESIAGDSVKGGSGSRVSVRAKKAKAIYDPSEYNGPVHKRKKEALEAERNSKTPVKSAKQSLDLQPKSPVQSPVKVATIIQATTTTSEVQTKVKSQVKRILVSKRNSAPEAKKRSHNKKPATPSLAVEKPTEAPVVPATSKEPSKRIQARKQTKTSTSAGTSKSKRESSASSADVSDDYDRASTIEFGGAEIPVVQNWTHQQVFEYFSTNLGFSRRDSVVFVDEEIDGEALMIMKRSDIVTTKFQKLKLGTALKMWSRILMFQTGLNDPTQAWK